MNIKNIALASACVGGVLLFSAFGGSKMTLEEQTKKIEATVAENVATFEARKREECRAMALQKAIGLAETKLAEEAKTSGKAAMTKKGAPAPKKAPKVTPKAAPKPAPPAPVTPAPKSKFEKAADEVKKQSGETPTQNTPSGKFKKAADAVKNGGN